MAQKSVKSNELVAKSNALVTASYRLDLVEQRIILFAITEARKTQKGLNATDFVTIRAKDYAEIYKVAPNKAYEHIKESVKTLFSREFTLYDTHPESGNPRVITARWLSATSYIDGSGEIQIQFSGVVIPYITRLEENFTRYKLEQIAGMTSPYAMRLYELLLQWLNKCRVKEFEITWIKNILTLQSEYPRLFDFKKWVIDVAVSQINEHSDLTCSYTQRKTGRTVTHLTFEFAPKVVEAEPKPARKAPKTATKPSDEATGRAKALRDYARTKAMLDAMNGTH